MSAKEAVLELVSNRKARFNYEILDTLETGIVLVGTEVKSLRMHHASLEGAFVQEEKGSLWLLNCTIEPYKFGNIHNHVTNRPRKLLVHKYETRKWAAKTAEKGLTMIPLRLYFKNGLIKVEIGLGKGKKMHDKRESIKERELKRSLSRESD